jgi:hypothetical protein
MSAAKVVEQLRAATRVVREGTSPDVERIYHRRMANDQALTVTIFGMAAVDGLRRDCNLLLGLRTRYQLSTTQARQVAADLLAGHADTLRRRYGLSDTAELVLTYAAAIQTTDEVEAWTLLQREMNDYLHYLSHAIAVHIPWHELSVAFEGARVVNVGYDRRLTR